MGHHFNLHCERVARGSSGDSIACAGPTGQQLSVTRVSATSHAPPVPTIPCNWSSTLILFRHVRSQFIQFI
ncbi:hypothetical protein TorRG33x02_097770 [Trema orientale]|uniref:Uncharacterized protein n=1 Tax=Trema orientale TaxID=63057 RepID=A0A2P5F942_TREOI|nr:hypothetical protein TorRG33x02_097770 [Trema orientale]